MNEINLAHLDLNLLVTFEVLMTERSVTHAADRLSRTQSAVSHSLARLREQLGDPLLVKVGADMVPSPFAMRLVEEVRPILRSIQRIAAPTQNFDAATSERTFRVAISDFTPSVFPELMALIQKQAPGVAMELSATGTETPKAIADGYVDVALMSSATPMPDGIERQAAGDLQARCYMRRAHPAVANWCLAEWSRWPHAQAMLGDRQQTTLQKAIAQGQIKRRIGVRVPNYSCVLDLLSVTDMIATLPLLLPCGQLERLNLCALAPPMLIDPIPFSFFWSFQQTNDPGGQWLRSLLTEIFAKALRALA